MKRWVRFGTAAAAFALLVAAAPAAVAQDAFTVQVVQVDESRFPEVDVYVSVTDAAGQPVTTLQPGDFVLEENGQVITALDVTQAGEQGPITVVLAIDKSGSMIEGKMEAAREAAVAFVELMRPGDLTGVVAFDTEVTVVQPLSGDQAALVAAIRTIEMGSDTALYDALHVALGLLDEAGGRTAVIAVTDGMNTAGVHTLEETMRLAGGQGVSIYAIGLGDPAQGTGAFAGIDERTLQGIADRSSGAYVHAPGAEDLRGLYELLSVQLQNEYRLTYRSPSQLRDGVRRDVAVAVAAPSGAAEAAGGYNPGGFIPEVAPRSTWGTFVPLFALLVLLLALPGAIRLARSRRAKPAKGRIRLTGGPGGSRR